MSSQPPHEYESDYPRQRTPPQHRRPYVPQLEHPARQRQPNNHSQPETYQQRSDYRSAGMAPTSVALPDRNGGLAIAGLFLGAISTPFILVTALSYTFALLGFMFSLLGLRSVQRYTLAVWGLRFSVIGFIASLAASGYGLYLALHH